MSVIYSNRLQQQLQDEILRLLSINMDTFMFIWKVLWALFCLDAWMQKLELDLESLRKIETFEYKLDIFLKLDSECPFWHYS